MTDEYRNDCVEPQRFPTRPLNRSSLSHIRYRIGTYGDMRDAMLRRLNQDSVLVGWTHREPDDPGIALLEGAAILGDILTFYQELYANEAYLRTAQWRESIADLVRLLGYRLSPGLGGRATFALGVKGKEPVVVPAGFTFKAQVEGLEQPAEFQSVAAAIAYPHLSQFYLYRPRRALQPIAAGGNQLEVQSVDGAKDLASIAAVGLKAGDRLMLIPSTTMFDITGTPYTAQQPAEILIVSKVQQILDRTIVEFEGTFTVDRGTTIKAYRLGRTFRHFGHNAPALTTKLDNGTQKTTQTATDFIRNIYSTDMPTDPNYGSQLLETEMPLDQRVDDLAVGNKLICQGFTQFTGQTAPVPFVVVKEIRGIRSDSLRQGNLTGSSTVVQVNAKLIANDSILNEESDIRQIQFHEVKSGALTLRSPTKWNNGGFPQPKLNFWGTYDEVRALANRTLLLQKDDAVQALTVTNPPDSFSLSGKDQVNPWMWLISLDRKPDALLLQDFDEQEPTVAVYGNLVEATQGKAEKPAVLGNGDQRQVFQTFKLPKAPLTYFNSSSETPPEVPELQVYVSDRLWKRVPSLFGKSPKDQIYIVREDANGESWIQFGDGKTGARLPSGLNNVVTQYRTGIGAFGALKENTTVQGGKLDRLDKVWLPGITSGGSQPETGNNAKEAAPGKIQSLGRLVSIQDFESETLALAGVSKAKAAWKLVNNIPTMVLTVLMETGREAELEEVRTILNTYNRCRGPQRFPIRVHQGVLKYIYTDITVGISPSIPEDIIRTSIKTVLGVSGDEGNGINGSKGLMSVKNRQFGQKEYATRIEGTVQNVEGVVWSKVTSLGFTLGSDDNPAELTLPTSKVLSPVLGCGDECVLSLYISHLAINFTLAGSQEVCE